MNKIMKLIGEFIEISKERNENVNDKIVSMVEDIEKLEIKLADAMYKAERFGDLNDKSDFRTAEVNKIKRILDSKKRLLETLVR